MPDIEFHRVLIYILGVIVVVIVW